MQSMQCFLDPKTIIAALTLLVGTVGGTVAYLSYRRNEKWKRAEFLAKEMKDFFADERVQQTMTMIDWGARRIRLASPDSLDGVVVAVNRSLQSRALRPHNILGSDFTEADLTEQPNGEFFQRYTESEASIRDCYGRFLDGLETFSKYVESDLCEVEALRPFLGYWIAVMQSPETGNAECAWKASLLSYIHFYRYEGVNALFTAFGYDIKPSSGTYRSFLVGMEDKGFASALARSVGIKF